MTDDAQDPRDAVLELLLDPEADPHRRGELRAMVERDPAAAAELAEFERIDDLLRTAGPMLVPSDALVNRVLAVPEEARAEADVPWDAAVAHEPQVAHEELLDGELAPPASDGPTLLADLMPPSRRPPRERRGRRERGGFFGNIVVWRAATVVAAAAAIVLGVIALRGNDDKSTTAATTVTAPADTSVTGAPVALTAAKGETAKANVVAEPTPGATGRRVHLVVEGLAPTGNSVYTVWVARSPARRIAIGTFKPDAQGKIDVTLTIPNLPPEFKGIWLTREKPNGAPGWSKDWVVKGSLAAS